MAEHLSADADRRPPLATLGRRTALALAWAFMLAHIMLMLWPRSSSEFSCEKFGRAGDALLGTVLPALVLFFLLAEYRRLRGQWSGAWILLAVLLVAGWDFIGALLFTCG